MFKGGRSPFIARWSGKRRSSARSSLGTPRSRIKQKKQQKNIKVCVRVRPRNQLEMSHSESRVVVRVIDENLLTFDPLEQQTPSYYKGQIIKDPTAKRNKDLNFAFDSVFDCDATTRDVYEQTTRMAIEKILEGVNCSVFAYGATGAGKTHTMVGNSKQSGVIVYTMEELYERIESMKDDMICEVKISYLEIYNENVRDLLKPESGDLPLMDADEGLTVGKLSVHTPSDASHLLELVDFGNKNRTQHPTDANKESSRSHGVFQVFLEQRPRTAGVSSDVLVSKMALIDLAGSERATATKNCGKRFREGANINRSLLALGNCINALAEGKRGAHIPYRDSKLTRILKDSLGGNCQTIMIANVSPSALSYDDTYNTLKYANRAKNIKAETKQNVVHVDYHIHQYTKIIQDLQAEVGELKDKLKLSKGENQFLVDKADRLERARKSQVSGCQAELLLESVRPILVNYLKMEQDVLHNETQYRLQELRIKERLRIQDHLEKAQMDSARLGKDTEKTARIRSQCETRQEALMKKIVKCKEGIRSLKPLMLEEMITFLKEQKSVGKGCAYAIESLERETRELQLKAENEYLRSVINQECGVVENQNKLITQAIELVTEQHYIIQGNNRMTSHLSSMMDNVVRLVQGIKEVAWRDEETAEKAAFDLKPLPFCGLSLSEVVKQTPIETGEEDRAIGGAKPAESRWKASGSGKRYCQVQDENVGFSSPIRSFHVLRPVKSLDFDSVTETGPLAEAFKGFPETCSPAVGLNDTYTKLTVLDSPVASPAVGVRARLRSPPPQLHFEEDENMVPEGDEVASSDTFFVRHGRRDTRFVRKDFLEPESPATVPLRGILSENSRNQGSGLELPARNSTEVFKKPTLLPPPKRKKLLAPPETRGRLKKLAFGSAIDRFGKPIKKNGLCRSPGFERSPSCSKLPDFDTKLPSMKMKKTVSSSRLH